MKKLIGFLTVIVLLAGCSSSKMLSIYQTEGIEIGQDSSGIDIINKYRTSRSITTPQASLAICIAQELDNSPVVLTSDNYVGPHWWSYNSMPNQQAITVNGGETIKLMEGNNIVANAMTDYQYYTKYFISFTLTATRYQDHINYLFSHIKQAQQFTGSVINNGFQSIKTLESSHPNLVLDALNKEVDKVHVCLLGNSFN